MSTARSRGSGTTVVLLAAIVFAATAAPADAAFPGRNGLFATVYQVVDRGGGLELELRLIDRRGKAKRRFAKCERVDESEPISGRCPTSPAFSADGREIAYGHGDRLALQSVTGGPPAVLPKLTQRDSDPYPSPDGSKLVFTGRVAGKANVFVVDRDGSDLKRLTQNGGQSPAWSSRGEIAYSARGKIWRMKPGRKPTLVATGAMPDWSPSGTAIVYVSRGSIYRVAARRGASRTLVRGRALAAAFSPDGRSIVFSRGDPELDASLFTARSRNGSGIRRHARGSELPVGSTWDSWRTPAWQPLR